MIVITLARKPLEGTLVSSMEEFGTGALNIDACRIGVSTSPEGLGRWPANVLLKHTSECEKVGTKTIPGFAINRWEDGAHPFGGGAGNPFSSTIVPPLVVDDWKCSENCPVAKLRKQSSKDAEFYFKQTE